MTDPAPTDPAPPVGDPEQAVSPLPGPVQLLDPASTDDGHDTGGAGINPADDAGIADPYYDAPGTGMRQLRMAAWDAYLIVPTEAMIAAGEAAEGVTYTKATGKPNPFGGAQ